MKAHKNCGLHQKNESQTLRVFQQEDKGEYRFSFYWDTQSSSSTYVRLPGQQMNLRGISHNIKANQSVIKNC